MSARPSALLPALLLTWSGAVLAQDRWPPHHDIGDAAGAAALARARATWTDAASWQARAQRLREHLAATLQLAPRPQAGPVGAEVTGSHELAGYAVDNVRFETMPGLFVHGNVYRPLDRPGPHPLVLRSHGHWGGTERDPEGRFQADVQRLAGLLARAGAVVITWDMLGWGESRQLTHARPQTTALQTFDTMRILDAALAGSGGLAALHVDPDRVAMTGSSGGGTQTFLAAALDPRIGVCAPVVMVSAHFFGGCKCESGLPIHDVPASADRPRLRASNVELAALAAPRPQLLVSVGGDWTRNTPEVEFPYLRDVYQALGAEDAVANAHFGDEHHDYGPSKRAAVVRFLAPRLQLDEAALFDEQGALDERHVTVLPREQLQATDAEHPLPERALQGDDAVWRAFLALPR